MPALRRPLSYLKASRETKGSNVRYSAIAGGIVLAAGLSLGLEKTVFCDRPAPQQSRSDSIETVEEVVTHTMFPITLFGYEYSYSVHWLLNTSVRCMLGMCSWDYARAYSYAVYISQTGLEHLKEEKQLGMELNQENIVRQLFPMPNTKSQQLEPYIQSVCYEGRKIGYEYKERDGYYLKANVGAGVGSLPFAYPSCVLRLVMLREVKCSHVARGFDTTLKRRLQPFKVNGSLSVAEQTACQEFLQVIKKDGTWKKGTVLELIRLPNGRLEVVIDGKSELLLNSEAVSFGLFDAYVGKNGHLTSQAWGELLDRTKEIIGLL